MLNYFLELLKVALSDDNLFTYQGILSGKFFIMLGGWLEFTLMYNGLLSGLLYGLYLPVARFSIAFDNSVSGMNKIMRCCGKI